MQDTVKYRDISFIFNKLNNVLHQRINQAGRGWVGCLIPPPASRQCGKGSPLKAKGRGQGKS